MIRLLAALLAAWLLAFPLTASAESPYVIGAPCLEGGSCTSPEVEALFQEAYHRAGAEVKFAYLPLLRDLIEADRGTIDGSLVRSKSVIADYPNLIFVDTPISKNTLVAFTVKPMRLKRWEDLARLNVGVIRGVLRTIKLCEEHGIEPYVVNSIPQAFAMLAKGRLDAVIYNLHVGTIVARSQEIEVFPSEVRHTDMFYHALHRRHAEIIPRLAEAFRAMYKDGTSARLLGKWAAVLPETQDIN